MARVVVEGLVKRFDTAAAVDGVSFVVEEGEIFTLLGPSGCGKTTTLRCIAGLERPDGGRIMIGEETVFDRDRAIFIPPEKRSIGMVFQSFAIWPHMTVFDNVAFPLRLRRVSPGQVQASVLETLRGVRLEGLERRFPSQLSGGQQQRVVLARCLVYRPRVILLDEPLANLDAKLREEMRSELREVQQAFKITTVYVTHDQAEAMALSDRVAVLRDGVILRQDSPRDVFRQPEHPFVAGFVGASNLFNARVAGHGEAGWLEVEVPMLGQMRVAAPPGAVAEPGRSVVISVRPTDISMNRNYVDSSPNTWRARVERVAYLGETLDCWVRVEGVTLRVRASADGNWERGDEVRVEIPPDRVSLLKAEGEHG
jgi:iron(III) transport system ATP-binding protein